MCDKSDMIQEWYEKAKRSSCLNKRQLAFWLCGELAKREDKAEVLQLWADEVYWKFSLPESRDDDLETENRRMKWQEHYGEFFVAAVGLLGKKRVSRKQFYTDLSELIWNRAFFDEDSQALALDYYLNSVYCPYFELEQGIVMENSEFRKKLEHINLFVHQIQFIMQQNFDQKTQRASLINQVFDMIEDEREKAVLMSWFLNFMESKDNK